MFEQMTGRMPALPPRRPVRSPILRCVRMRSLRQSNRSARFWRLAERGEADVLDGTRSALQW